MAEENNIDHGDRGHSKVSPSGLKNFDQCGEYIAQNFDQPDHPVTIEGTFLHEFLELWEEKRQGNKKVKLPALNEEQTKLTDMCIEYLEDLDSWGNEVIIEPRLKITDNMWGFVDRLQFSQDGTHVDIVDWKFGWNKVEDAETNLQGLAYMVGVLRKFEKVKTVTIHFVQPRIKYITTGDFTRSDIGWIVEKVGAITEVIGDKLYFYKEDVCQYCSNVDCPIVKNSFLTVARRYQTEIAVPDNLHSSQITNPEDMGKLLDLIPQLEAYIKSVKHHAKVMVEEESWEIPGYETYYKKGTTKVTDVNLVFDIVNRDYGVGIDHFVELIKTVPLGALQDLVAKHAPRGTKGKVKEKLMADLADCDAIHVGKESLTLRKVKKKK